jgi:hypothetical protein
MNNEKERINKELNTLYKEYKFFDLEYPQGLLHESCNNADACWNGLSVTVKTASKWNYFSLPFIGENYTGELMFVGLNVHEGGGRNLQEAQIRVYDENKQYDKNDIFESKYEPGVIQTLKQKRKSVKFETGMKRNGIHYGGTLLWHRIAVYSKILLDGYKDRKSTRLNSSHI